MSVSKTIVISCAGMGTRLGIGSTKALIDIDGKPLIISKLELLKIGNLDTGKRIKIWKRGGRSDEENNIQ